MKVCKRCSGEITGLRRLYFSTKYCLECARVVHKDRPKPAPVPNRVCVVCKSPSVYARHRGCEFKSLKAGRGSLSKSNSRRRYDLKKKEAASDLLEFVGITPFIN